MHCDVPRGTVVLVDLDERYLELIAKVDDFFDQVHERHRSEMQCSSGCSDCCSRFSVTLIEAAHIARGLAEMPAADRARLAERARASSGSCAALDGDGRCSIYRWRPLICRSHGVPIRRRDARSLPVVEVCPKNFTAGLDAVPGADVLDQERLSTVLGALDSAMADAAGVPRGTRIELADLLADPGAFFAVDD